jgi:hypothetical protein
LNLIQASPEVPKNLSSKPWEAGWRPASTIVAWESG